MTIEMHGTIHRQHYVYEKAEDFTAFILACIPAGSLGTPPGILAPELPLELPGPVGPESPPVRAACTTARGDAAPEDWLDDSRGWRLERSGPESDTERTCVRGMPGGRRVVFLTSSEVSSDWMERWLTLRDEFSAGLSSSTAMDRESGLLVVVGVVGVGSSL